MPLAFAEPEKKPSTASLHSPDKRWLATIGLRFVDEAGKTRLRRVAAEGPLYVQQPFYPEGPVCHVYLLHPPGGVAGGDELEISLDVREGARALLTTPAATKFYRAESECSVRQQFDVEAGAALEWLPQENLLFGGCRATLETRVNLDARARYIGWEINGLGRPASGDNFETGRVEQRIGIYRRSAQGEPLRPLLVERNRWGAADRAIRARWGLAGYRLCGSLYATPADADIVDFVRARCPLLTGAGESLVGAITLVNDILVARVLAVEAEAARDWLASRWADLRPLILQRPACPPRIWRT